MWSQGLDLLGELPIFEVEKEGELERHNLSIGAGFTGQYLTRCTCERRP
jgi:hypothetical protein